MIEEVRRTGMMFAQCRPFGPRSLY